MNQSFPFSRVKSLSILSTPLCYYQWWYLLYFPYTVPVFGLGRDACVIIRINTNTLLFAASLSCLQGATFFFPEEGISSAVSLDKNDDFFPKLLLVYFHAKWTRSKTWNRRNICGKKNDSLKWKNSIFQYNNDLPGEVWRVDTSCYLEKLSCRHHPAKTEKGQGW